MSPPASDTSWLIELRDPVLAESSDAAAARALFGRGQLPAPARARVAFLRAAWIGRPTSPSALVEALARRAAAAVAEALEVDGDSAAAALEAATQGGALPAGFEPESRRAHHALLYLGLRHLEGITHLNPWRDGTTGAGRVLSNMAPTPFELGGVRFASAESYLQSLRVPPDQRHPCRIEVAAAPAQQAQAAERSARRRASSAAMSDPVWLWGQEASGAVERRSGAFEAAMTEAHVAKARAHPQVIRALAVSEDLPVVHYVRMRYRYKLKPHSHLPRCLPAARERLRGTLDALEWGDGERLSWLAPSVARPRHL